MVPAISNIGLAFLEVLPFPPLYFKDAKLLLSLSKIVTICFRLYHVYSLFWSVIKSYEFLDSTNFIQISEKQQYFVVSRRLE